MSRGARRRQGAWAHNLWVSGRGSGCPHSLLQRSSAGCLPCTSCSGAQWTARGGRGRRGQTGGRGRSRKWRGESRRVRHVDDHGWSVKALRT